MSFEGKYLTYALRDGGVAELTFDAKEESVNKFSLATLDEFATVIGLIQANPAVRGLLVTSAKDNFMVGADVTEFQGHFRKSVDDLRDWLMTTHRLFAQVEDFPFPSVTAINGFAVGGALEFALTNCYRVLSSKGRIGLPETKLGIFPGWGGTVRLSRVAGADNAIEWIASGEQYPADVALKYGVVDAVAAPERLREAALDLLAQAMEGRLDWRARQEVKRSPLKLNAVEATMVFESSKAAVGARTGPNYPAALAAIDVIQRGAGLGRDEAIALEAAAFALIAKTPTASNLVNIFLGDQAVGKLAKKVAKEGGRVQSAAVLGAGIMGGGIAYQSASKGVPIVMKDIAEKALALGLAEADKLLVKRVEQGKLQASAMAETLNRIRPTLGFGDFKEVDLVVEAVVENEQVKKAVLADLEGQVKEDAILASNTSTISITRLGADLRRPANFCGMHFFNPVHRMPLVEVIRGEKSSDRAVATTVSYALAMGKTPIVVNDCPGFLVNRLLIPYFHGFIRLVNDGVDFQRIDKVMETFGWPMGPAYLLDVVGIDTAHHACEVMGQGFPDRMATDLPSAVKVMYEARRLGQKNGKGFYAYEPDRKGVPRKAPDPEAPGLLAALAPRAPCAVSDQDIVDRMMLPMVIEASRCLEDGIVGTPVEVDMGLVYGLGFPTFRGGALRYADATGLQALCVRAASFRHLGRLYEPTAQMLQLAEAGRGFYEEN